MLRRAMAVLGIWLIVGVWGDQRAQGDRVAIVGATIVDGTGSSATPMWIWSRLI